MTKKPKLKLSDRLEIKILLDKKYSNRDIAKVLGRSPNTISYEIKLNGGKNGYNPDNANQYSKTRKKDSKIQWKKIEQNKELKLFIISKLQLHWNPDEIAGYMKKKRMKIYISKNSIYRWLYSNRGQQYCHLLYTRRYSKKKRVTKTERVMIPNRVSISDRSKLIDKRKQYGHWEYDTMVSQKGCRGGISVGSERKSKLIVGNKVLSMSTTEHIDLIGRNTEIHKTLSITMDNGIENKGYQKLGIPTFFCDPYSSWQKGGVENANKMIRRYFPKGTNFNKVSKSSLDYVIKLINEKPRKILGYRSALEVAKKAGIIKNINS